MIFLVIFISVIIAFFIRILDIFVIFEENGIKLSFVESIIAFLILLKAFGKGIKSCIKNKNWQGTRNLLVAFLVGFQPLLVIISCTMHDFAMISGIKVPGKLHDDKRKIQLADITKDEDIPLLINVVKEVNKIINAKHPHFSFNGF
ncbi:hypothetical protein PS376_03260 [Limosilactobacillus pontis]|uniref:hypothetical protein n=1 Tax=Limosilactobacillus pontis TaxID=35787 RepID=UPI002F266454